MKKKPGSPQIWKPKYTINAEIARVLMDIEAAKAVVDHTPLSPAVEADLRHKARIRSTHYSTRIEGNRLTLKEAETVLEKKKASFHGRERDVNEVRNYWEALLKVEEWAVRGTELSEDMIKRLHALVEHGKKSGGTSYRDGQNIIRDSQSGGIVYLPPESSGVPALMAGMVMWVVQAEKEKIPAPIIAALLHYQFVTIHPYYDGNGRTARLLATFILQRDGYGMHGFFSMEEHHARDLASYYQALSVHEHHNYYFGRADADLTPWLAYFGKLLADVFVRVKEETLAFARNVGTVEPKELRKLDHRTRVVLGLFGSKDTISTQDIVLALGLSSRMVRILIQGWVKDGFLVVANATNRARSYSLSAIYRKFIGND